jgi:hypothetical protein
MIYTERSQTHTIRVTVWARTIKVHIHDPFHLQEMGYPGMPHPIPRTTHAGHDVLAADPNLGGVRPAQGGAVPDVINGCCVSQCQRPQSLEQISLKFYTSASRTSRATRRSPSSLDARQRHAAPSMGHLLRHVQIGGIVNITIPPSCQTFKCYWLAPRETKGRCQSFRRCVPTLGHTVEDQSTCHGTIDDNRDSMRRRLIKFSEGSFRL